MASATRSGRAGSSSSTSLAKRRFSSTLHIIPPAPGPSAPQFLSCWSSAPHRRPSRCHSALALRSALCPCLRLHERQGLRGNGPNPLSPLRPRHRHAGRISALGHRRRSAACCCEDRRSRHQPPATATKLSKPRGMKQAPTASLWSPDPSTSSAKFAPSSTSTER